MPTFLSKRQKPKLLLILIKFQKKYSQAFTQATEKFILNLHEVKSWVTSYVLRLDSGIAHHNAKPK